MMEQLYQSGLITLFILAIMAAEAIFFARYIKKMPAIIFGLGAGACVILALRAALLEQGWEMIALYLSLSFVFHAGEIWNWLRLAKMLDSGKSQLQSSDPGGAINRSTRAESLPED